MSADAHRDPPDWKLELYLLADLPEAEIAAIRAREQLDPGLRDRLAALRRSNEEIIARYPAAWTARQIRQALAAPADKSRRRPAPLGRLWPAVPALALLLTLALLPTLREDPAQMADGFRTKGLPPHLILHRKTAAGSEQLQAGDLARERDLIRIQYNAAGHRYGAIVSVDGRGAVTRHLPLTGAAAAALGQGVVALATAYQLDDAPRWERFYFVTSPEPFGVAAVIAAAQAAGRGDGADSLALAAGLSQFSATLLKAGAP